MRGAKWLKAGLLGLAGLLQVSAQAVEIKVLTAGAFKPVLAAVQQAFEAKSGHQLVLVNDTAGGLQKRILAGESFDLVVSSPASLKAMREAAKIADTDPLPLARVAIGVAVAPGQPLPDVSTVAQFRQTLMQARRVAYIDPSAGGSSGIYLDGLFERWGIRDQVRAKAVLVPGGLVAAKVMDGSADLAIHQISEIKAVAGAVLVGPLPPEIQNYTVYSAAWPHAPRSQAVTELLEFLKSPQWGPMWSAKGMEPL